MSVDSACGRGRLVPTRLPARRYAGQLRRVLPGCGRANGARGRRDGAARTQGERPVRRANAVEAGGLSRPDVRRHGRSSLQRGP